MDDSTRAVYEECADEWARRRPPRLGKEAAAFSHRCLPDRPIVDLGCGPGSYFAALGRPLVGVDGARAMLRRARATTPGVALVQADLAQLPFARRSFGGAWARASYLHLRRPDLPAALAHLHHALAVGAPLELTMRSGTADGPLPDDEFPGRFFAGWQADDLAAVVVGAGFDLVEAVTVGGEWLTVRATAAPTLPDFVGDGMRVLVCGLNPSVVAADAGYGYAGATNRFWRAAVRAGLVGADHARQPLAMLGRERVGMTDLVKRATPRARELRPADYRAGAVRVTALVEWLHPAVVLFVGLAGYRAAVARGAHPGWQEPFGGVPTYVMPSTSGLNATASLSELVEHLRAAGAGAAP
ncbi:MAG TPA: methyltransferase domain-containing protein [Acidimicrobiales bacterium]|nr:methyltransferase domain-containing protein [Acidimicrobiales bacterium]